MEMQLCNMCVAPQCVSYWLALSRWQRGLWLPVGWEEMGWGGEWGIHPGWHVTVLTRQDKDCGGTREAPSDVSFYVQDTKGLFFIFLKSGMQTGWRRTRLRCGLRSVMLDSVLVHTACLLTVQPHWLCAIWVGASRASLLCWTRSPSGHLLFPKQTQRGLHEHATATRKKTCHNTSLHAQTLTWDLRRPARLQQRQSATRIFC